MIDRASSGLILVVDGNRKSREWIAARLCEAGYRVTAVGTSADAWARAEEIEFDIAIIDYEMPFAGPVDLFRRLRWRCPRIRGIFLTDQSSAYGTASALSAAVERVVNRTDAVGTSGAGLHALVASCN